MVELIGVALSSIKFLVVVAKETALGYISLGMCSDVYESP